MNEDFNRKKTLRVISGIVLIIIGVTMVLIWWNDILNFLKAVLALGLAIGGLLVLYSLGSSEH